MSDASRCELGNREGLEHRSRGLAKMKWIQEKVGRLRRTLRETKWFTETIRNIVGDLRYGGYCGGVLPPPSGFPGANKTQSIYYSTLAKVFLASGVKIAESDVLVDVGCGKGRVINYWLSLGCQNKIVGIELNEQIAEGVRKRLQNWKNVTILTGDAVQNIPLDGTLFWLFNPFGGEVMEAFRDRLVESFQKNVRPVTLVYYNALHADVFCAHPAYVVRDIEADVRYPAALISLRNR